MFENVSVYVDSMTFVHIVMLEPIVMASGICDMNDLYLTK